MGFRVLAENYRGLLKADWAPSGLCALVGPNGTGKTTLLDIPELLRHALERDFPSAVNHPRRGGAWFLRNLAAPSDGVASVEFATGGVQWAVAFDLEGATVSHLCREVVGVHDAIFAERDSQSSEIRFGWRAPAPKKRPRGRSLTTPRPVLAEFADMHELQPLVRMIRGYRFYRTYDLASLQRHGSQQTGDLVLDPDGTNLFAVLRNWRDTSAGMERWRFVMDTMRAAFPHQFRDLRFEVAGLTVTGLIELPAFDKALPVALALEGVLTGLLHLTAVASLDEGGAAAIDEFENSLHPHAIKALIEALRERCEDLGLTVTLATHAPVVIDQWKDQPERLFVIEPGADSQPTPVSQLRDPGYLAQFSLGDLYANEQFGAPAAKAAPGRNIIPPPGQDLAAQQSPGADKRPGARRPGGKRKA